MIGKSVVSAKLVTFGPTSRIGTKEGLALQAASVPSHRWIWNPSSFAELSAHEMLIVEELTEVAASAVGPAGGRGFTPARISARPMLAVPTQTLPEASAASESIWLCGSGELAVV